MPLKFMIRACGLVGALTLCLAFGAERKPSLIGATRDEVIARFGEPKSNIVAGSREVLFFTGERVVLRDNRVIEAEEIPVEAPPPPPPKPAVPSDAAATAATTTATDSGAAATPAKSAATPAATSATASDNANAPADSTAASTTVAPPPPPPEPEVIIKSIRPPSAAGITAPADVPESPTAAPAAGANAATTSTGSAATASAPVATASQSSTPTSVPATSSAASVASQPISKTAPEGTSAPTSTIAAATTAASASPTASSTAQENAGPSQAAQTLSASSAATTTAAATTAATSTSATGKATVAAKPRPSAPAAPPATESVFTAQTYIIALVIIVGGIGYLVWRRRQRNLLLEATAVSNPPFAPQPAAAAPGTRFTIELLNKLEWKRFEELVAAYYNKTGVVASRTKKGPGSPVHIRISWKGEQRPFACVLCLPHPGGLVDAKPIQSLSDALASEDVRRGYVVTSGKFGVPARDLAEEKHITLLSGDIFIEKLNALPEPVRNELMKDVTTGDYITPSCPTCDTKMTRSAADPSAWQCPQCGTVLPRV